MAVGDSSLIGGLSYIAVGRETAFGTYNTASTLLPVMSGSLKMVKENKILEQIECSRTYSKRVSMGRVLSGDLEFYFMPGHTGSGFILQNAFGGTVTSATTSVEGAETVGGGGFDHTFEIGNMDQSYPSMCFNVRKGQSSGAQVFEYSGMRVGEVSFSAELDDALKCSVSLIGKDASTTSNDVKSALTITANQPLNFDQGRISVETSFAALTTTSFWHVQSVNLGWSNSLKSDAASRRIGSDTLDILPPGIASFTFNATIRFDTSTAYDAMLAATELSAQLDFRGDTISGSVAREGLRFNLPSIYVSDGGDPEIGGPDDILTSEVVFHVLRDDSSAGGYACQAILTNTISSYA
jgi:hypothetical protein